MGGGALFCEESLTKQMLTHVELAGVCESDSSAALAHHAPGEGERSYVFQETGPFTETLLIVVSM